MSPPAIRRLDHRAFDVPGLVAAKGRSTVSVCLPARNEAATVGGIVDCLVRELVEPGLVDEVLVVDDRSSDGTAAAARRAGAFVVSTADGALHGLETASGKGEALWVSMFASSGDVVVWCDADIVDFGPRFVIGILGPLLTDDAVGFVKGFYERPVAGHVGTGGRVTELTARPLLALLVPELADIVQPLSGEYGGRREVLEELPFVQGYGVDVALLIDVAVKFGAGSIAQVDLGTRVHRNRTLDELSPQALQVMSAVLRRAEVDVPDAVELLRPSLEPMIVRHDERPRPIDVAAYRPGGCTA